MIEIINFCIAAAFSCWIPVSAPVVGTDAFRCDFPGRVYTTLACPRSIALGDLNEDGRADIVTGGGFWPHGFERLTIHLSNRQTGEFDIVTFQFSFGTDSIELGDVNGDSHLDIVQADGAFGDIIAYFGDGNGDFQVFGVADVSFGRLIIELADMDNDSDLDVIAVNETVNQVTIYWNSGNGGFTSNQSLPLNAAPFWVASGDLDDDGDMDIVVLNSDAEGTVTIIENVDSGDFAVAGNYPVGSYPYSVVLTDINNDQLPDIVTANRVSDDISLLLNLGDGLFADEFRHAVGDSPEHISSADVDFDSDLDLLVANQNSDDLHLLLNDGSGGFAEAVLIPVGERPSAIASGDVDGDSIDDFAVTRQGADDFMIFSISKEGVPSSARPYLTNCSEPSRSIACSDINADGFLDIAATCYSGDQIVLLLNDGKGGLLEPVEFTVGEYPREVGFSDLNGDGELDIYVTTGWEYGDEGFVRILLGDGNGGYTAQQPISVGRNPAAVVSGDFDGDLDDDLAITTGNSDVPGQLLILLNQGDATFEQDGPFPIGDFPTLMTMGEFDLNSETEFAIRTQGVVYVVAYSPMSGMQVLNMMPRNLKAAGDYDGDGDLDLVVDSEVRINDGFAQFALGLTGDFSEVSDLVDIDRDGDGDFFGYATYRGAVSFRENTQNGLAPAIEFAAGSRIRDLAFIDLDSDQDLEILASDFNKILVLQQSCIRLGDINMDGVVNVLDVAPFVELIVAQTYQDEADVNGDGLVNLLDVSPFIALLDN